MYRLKHIPTGLYYQPHKHRGSSLSKRGKIYQTGTHGLSEAYRIAEREGDLETRLFQVQVEKNSQAYKLSKDILMYKDCRHSYGQAIADTFLKDWVKEPI